MCLCMLCYAQLQYEQVNILQDIDGILMSHSECITCSYNLII